MDCLEYSKYLVTIKNYNCHILFYSNHFLPKCLFADLNPLTTICFYLVFFSQKNTQTRNFQVILDSNLTFSLYLPLAHLTTLMNQLLSSVTPGVYLKSLA